MHDLERNKILAALLVAGIVASVSGFAAKKLIAPQDVKAAGAESAGDSAGAPAAPEAPEPILALIAGGDAAHGKQVAAACGACHNLEKGGPNNIGPNLWNVLTRGRAAKADFTYSDAMAKHKGEMWTYEELNKFIWKPNYDTPGTKMTFMGLKKTKDRVDVIAYLRTLNDTPPAPPSAAEIAKEQKDLAPAAPAAPAKDTKAPVDQKGAAATPVTGAKTPAQAEAPETQKSDTTPAKAPATTQP